MYYYHVYFTYSNDEVEADFDSFIELSAPIEYASDINEIKEFLAKKLNTTEDLVIIKNFIPLKGKKRNK